jgi:hypothetical protein
MDFMEEYLELTQGAKIELLDGRLVIGDSPNHAKRLPTEAQNSPYTNPYRALYQMHPNYDITLVNGNCPDDAKEETWIQQAMDLG